MLTINKPEVLITESEAILHATFECEGVDNTLWFSTTKDYEQYLCHERGDAFVVGLLLYAMKRGEDIKILVPISERLYYALTNHYIKYISEIFPGYKKINIYCDIDSGHLNGLGAVGTGLSCGVDSFSTVIEHTRKECPSGYRLTHLTFFNVGASGDFGGENARILFKKRIKEISPCADEYGLPLVTLDSNINEILEMNFVPTHTYRNVAAVMALQKLFKIYYYSSGYSVKQFEATCSDSSHYDVFGLDMLSTNDLKFFSSGAVYSRVEKTEMLISEPLTYKYLNVCVKAESNCSTCQKCLRTMVTLDLFGTLNLYENVFDIRRYEIYKNRYMASIIIEKNTDPLKKEIYDEMRKRHCHIPFTAYFFIPIVLCYKVGRKIFS